MDLMKKTAWWFLMIWLLVQPCFAEDSKNSKLLYFKPNEAESMLVLFNETTVSGGDVELIARLGVELNNGFKEAKKLKGNDKTVTIHLNKEETRYCLAIINQSKFQAKYAGLVLGIKQKLTALLKDGTTKPLSEKEKK